MFKHIKLPLLAIALSLVTAILLYAPPSWAQMQENNPKVLMDQVWQLVYRDYVDDTFNRQDWQAVRQDYLSRTYASHEEVYTAIQDMVASLGDRYTVFLNPLAYEKLDRQTSGKVTGVGIELATDQETQALTVVDRIHGSPAFLAGILPRDVIVAIDGLSTIDMDLEVAIKHILGPVNTPVELTVRRENQELSFQLVRQDIVLRPVVYQVYPTAMGPMGYIDLPEFTATAPGEMQQAIAQLQAAGVKGYLLDLRADPGGLLDASIEIADMWLDQGTIVSLTRRKGGTEVYQADAGVLTEQPLVVLVDQGSASASEILSAALQEQGRAILVGSRTFGKGLVQTVHRLEAGAGLKLTTAHYYTPKGQDIHGIGIQPDIVVDLTPAERRSLIHNHSFGTPDDPQFARAMQELIQHLQSPLESAAV